MYRIIISRVAEKQIASLPKNIANTIASKIDGPSQDPGLSVVKS